MARTYVDDEELTGYARGAGRQAQAGARSPARPQPLNEAPTRLARPAVPIVQAAPAATAQQPAAPATPGATPGAPAPVGQPQTGMAAQPPAGPMLSTPAAMQPQPMPIAGVDRAPIPEPTHIQAYRNNMAIQSGLNQQMDAGTQGIADRMGIVANGGYANAVQRGVSPDIAGGMFARPAPTATAPNLSRGGAPIGRTSGVEMDERIAGSRRFDESPERFQARLAQNAAAIQENALLPTRRADFERDRRDLMGAANAFSRAGAMEQAGEVVGQIAGMERPGRVSPQGLQQQREMERLTAERGANDPRIFQSQEATRRAMLTQEGMDRRQTRSFEQQESEAERTQRFKSEQAERQREIEGLQEVKRGRANVLSKRVENIDRQIQEAARGLSADTSTARDAAAKRLETLNANRAKADDELWKYLDENRVAGQVTPEQAKQLVDQVAAEHPEWTDDQIRAEAKRRAGL